MGQAWVYGYESSVLADEVGERGVQQCHFYFIRGLREEDFEDVADGGLAKNRGLGRCSYSIIMHGVHGRRRTHFKLYL